MYEQLKLLRPEGNDLSTLEKASIGLVAQIKTVNKFGRSTNVDATATDIWDKTADQPIWLAPTAARVHSIVSTDEGDDSAGAGAKTVRVYGLKTWDTAESYEDITMDGTDAVNTEDSYVIIHRMKVLTFGTSGPNIGVITATAATDSTVTAQILAGQGQTQMVIYGVPSTQSLMIKSLHADMNKAGGATPLCDMAMLYNPYPNVVTTKFVTKKTFGLIATGSSSVCRQFDPPYILEGPGILKLQGLGSTADLDISGGFDAALVTK